ncbi:MAG TPA: UDP-3-O-(3-hydroxymyristoyl)glucosamine N-acyltransferase [Gemmatimonadaceae bacterium]
MTDGRSSEHNRSGERAGTLTAVGIAELVGGELRGEPSTVVDGVASLDRATPSQLSFLAQARYAPMLRDSHAGVVLVHRELADTPGDVASRVIVDEPHSAMLSVLPQLYPETEFLPGIHPTAVIGRGARIGAGVRLDEYVVIGEGASIGEGTWIGAHSSVGARATIGVKSRLFPDVTVYADSSIGERVILHSGVRIGSDGFGYVFRDGRHEKIPHVGRCIIGDDVEIGANTTIDRGSIDDTLIGSGTKIDNLVQVGHNVRIGRLCMIMAQVGIAGSARIGDGVVIAGQAGLGGHISIGDRARIGGQSGVFGDVPAGQEWSGYPARPHRESLRASAALVKLAGMMKRLEALLEQKDPR